MGIVLVAGGQKRLHINQSSWEIDGETVETVSDFIFLGSKITADGDCRSEDAWLASAPLWPSLWT